MRLIEKMQKYFVNDIYFAIDNNFVDGIKVIPVILNKNHTAVRRLDTLEILNIQCNHLTFNPIVKILTALKIYDINKIFQLADICNTKYSYFSNLLNEYSKYLNKLRSNPHHYKDTYNHKTINLFAILHIAKLLENKLQKEQMRERKEELQKIKNEQVKMEREKKKQTKEDKIQAKFDALKDETINF